MNQNVIERFYSAFEKMDADAMSSCYHGNIEFHDPAFGNLQGQHVSNMWRMLIESQKGKDFKIEFGQVHIDQESGSAAWEAWYTFSKTGRRVHNKIKASFVIKEDKIWKHHDHFSLHRWASQALGWKGFLIGWTTYFEQKIQKQTKAMLKRYEEKQ